MKIDKFRDRKEGRLVDRDIEKKHIYFGKL